MCGWLITATGWRSIAKRLTRTAAPLHVAAVTNLGYRHYANNLSRFYTCGPGAIDPFDAIAPRPKPGARRALRVLGGAP